MKFGQLPIGRHFRYQGDKYLKVSPLQAQRPEATKARLIPRSALIEALDQEDPPPPAVAEPIDPQALAQVMDRLGGEITDMITASGLDAEQSAALLGQIRQAFARARRSLQLD